MKRAVLINDLSGIGRCSLTVALPIVSALGIECAVLPTAVLSNHTAFSNFTFTDLTDNMREHIDCWNKLGFTYDAVYSGFLGSVDQIDITLEFMQNCGCAFKFVDPVMGDGGVAYTTYTPELISHMVRLTEVADVITPNLTELCLLCNTPYPTSKITLEDIKKLCKTVCSRGCKSVVVTGLEFTQVSDIEDNVITNFVYSPDYTGTVNVKKVPRLYCGTGDVFASVLFGKLLRGFDLHTAVKHAADFTHACTDSTYCAGGGPLYGVQFEDKLSLLSGDR